jgi:hypothetical protein
VSNNDNYSSPFTIFLRTSLPLATYLPHQ